MISRASISPEDVVVTRKNDPMVILREKENSENQETSFYGNQLMKLSDTGLCCPFNKPRNLRWKLGPREWQEFPRRIDRDNSEEFTLTNQQGFLLLHQWRLSFA